MDIQQVVEWKSVSDLPEGDARYVLVACRGGNVDVTFYNPDWKYFTEMRGGSSYSRKQHGKNSRHFGLCHEYGYEIMYWGERPSAPADVYTSRTEG